MKNVRYIHKQFQCGKIAGITVAYYRTEEELVFAWSKCIRPDNYSKETGRILSTKNLEDFAKSFASVPNFSNVDVIARQGVIKLNDVFYCAGEHYLSLTEVMSDQALNALKMTDFKHSFLSNVIIETILRCTRLNNST